MYKKKMNKTKKQDLAKEYTQKIYPHNGKNEVKDVVSKVKKGKGAKTTDKVVKNILGK